MLSIVLFKGNAVRLGKESHMADELWNIGLVSGKREKLECARYFEDIRDYEKAIILYNRAGKYKLCHSQSSLKP